MPAAGITSPRRVACDRFANEHIDVWGVAARALVAIDARAARAGHRHDLFREPAGINGAVPPSGGVNVQVS